MRLCGGAARSGGFGAGTLHAELGRAVAASACVPFVFVRLELSGAFTDDTVQLVDSGVHDHQGAELLLAANCNVVLVSNACGHYTPFMF